MPEFKALTDFCNTFKLHRGKFDEDEDDVAVVGEFKVWSLLIQIFYLGGGGYIDETF